MDPISTIAGQVALAKLSALMIKEGPEEELAVVVAITDVDSSEGVWGV